MTGRVVCTLRTPVLCLTALLLSAPGGPVTAGEPTVPLLGRLYVIVSPIEDPAGSGLVWFDVPQVGSPVQRETVETEGSGSVHSSPQAIAYDAAGHFLYACNNSSGTVAAFAVGDDGALSAVPGSPFSVGDGPVAIAVHPSLRILYVVTWMDSFLRAFAIGGDGALSETQSVPVTRATDFEIHPTGRFLYLADLETGVRGYAISPVGALSELPGSPFRYNLSRTLRIEVAPDGRRVFALDVDEGIAAFDVGPTGGLTLIEGSPFAVGAASDVLELTPSGSYLYVGSFLPVGITGYSVEPDGVPLPVGDFNPSNISTDLVALTGASTLLALRPDTGDFTPYAIAYDGSLTGSSNPTPIVDINGRVPNGALFVPTNCAVLCDDGVTCTADVCDPTSGCAHLAVNWDTDGFSASRVDGRDLAVLASAWNSCPDDPSYDAAANLDQVACVDLIDFHLFMSAFGRSCL
jgi:6-phosphogluconolactonase